MANSPALLNGYLALSAALSPGRLRAAVGEQIALAIAHRNGCDCCMSAHTLAAAQILHLEPATIDAARHAHSDKPKTAPRCNWQPRSTTLLVA